MKTGILLSYKGLGSNLLHLSYCHEIAKKFGPVSIITLCNNLQPVLTDDPLIKEVICLKNYYKKFIDIFKLSKLLKEINLDNLFIYYPSIRFFIAGKISRIQNIYVYPLSKKKLHLVKAAKQFTEKQLKIENCSTESRIFINKGYGSEVVRCEFISKPGNGYLNSDQLIIRLHSNNQLTIELRRDKLKDIQIPFFVFFRMAFNCLFGLFNWNTLIIFTLS